MPTPPSDRGCYNVFFFCHRHLHTVSTFSGRPPQGIGCNMLYNLPVLKDNTSQPSKYQLFVEDSYPAHCSPHFILSHIESVKKILLGHKKDILPAESIDEDTNNLGLFDIFQYTGYLGMLGSKLRMNYFDGKKEKKMFQ